MEPLNITLFILIQVRYPGFALISLGDGGLVTGCLSGQHFSMCRESNELGSPTLFSAYTLVKMPREYTVQHCVSALEGIHGQLSIVM